uniref:Putative tick transposon n=1 Tax=Rhipicephalus pulchellus TaxID=72859 RepID=L7M2T6_RHIPC
MGTRGTPQGAVLSPLLFNLAMLHLPAQLKDIDDVRHALYADDITIWATEGNLGHMEEHLQAAAQVVDRYADHCGLECAPGKSQFVHLRASLKDNTNIHLSLASGPIHEAKEIRILGLFIHHQRRVDTTLAKIRMIGDQVGRMVRRVSNKRGGLRSKDAVRLAHAFVTSRILYSVPYLRLRKHDEDRLEVILRKIMKRALDLPITTSNGRLLALGVVNTFQELKEAHLVNQYTRLAQTRSGQQLLARLHIQHDFHLQERVRVPELWRRAIRVRPLPTNMGREDHSGRRQARAEALERHYGNKHGVYYVDVAGPNRGGWYTAAVIHQGAQVDGLTFCAPGTTQAE